jgi:hypothetical protein
MNPAVEFLKKHGSESLLSLGCGQELNHIDNHVKLLHGLGLKYYVGIDRTPLVGFDFQTAFSDQASAVSTLSTQHNGKPEAFSDIVNVFGDTWVEELEGIHCRAVVCQRVLPFKHWEDPIKTMKPVVMLQEDLHGCELQDIGGDSYTKTRAGIRHYGLRPFRPYRFLPGEKNLILWRRRDFYTCVGDRYSRWKRFWK